jgi:hypothetical protein
MEPCKCPRTTAREFVSTYKGSFLIPLSNQHDKQWINLLSELFLLMHLIFYRDLKQESIPANFEVGHRL